MTLGTAILSETEDKQLNLVGGRYQSKCWQGLNKLEMTNMDLTGQNIRQSKSLPLPKDATKSLYQKSKIGGLSLW